MTGPSQKVNVCCAALSSCRQKLRQPGVTMVLSSGRAQYNRCCYDTVLACQQQQQQHCKHRQQHTMDTTSMQIQQSPPLRQCSPSELAARCGLLSKPYTLLRHPRVQGCECRVSYSTYTVALLGTTPAAAGAERSFTLQVYIYITNIACLSYRGALSCAGQASP